MKSSRTMRAMGFTVLLVAFGVHHCACQDRKTEQPQSDVPYEHFGNDDSSICVVLLHGASGPGASYYRDQAKYFAQRGLHVLMPHYFEATRSADPTLANERVWVSVVRSFVSSCRNSSATRSVFLIGFSLGASVALAAGSQGVAVDGIADWYGSLPDDFFYRLKTMPPLLILHGAKDSNIPLVNAEQLVTLCSLKRFECEHHFYPNEDHGFSEAALLDADQRTLRFFSRKQMLEPK